MGSGLHDQSFLNTNRGQRNRHASAAKLIFRQSQGFLGELESLPVPSDSADFVKKITKRLAAPGTPAYGGFAVVNGVRHDCSD
jgi:hypothetical protein